MGSVEQGAEQAVKNCIKVKKGERVVIITDKQTITIGRAIKRVVESITDDLHFFLMEDFGERPLNFPEEIGKILAEADVSFTVIEDIKGETQTFTNPLFKVIAANKKLRHASMAGITKEVMENGMCSDHEEIKRISRLVYEKVKNAFRIRVTTDKGTDFVAKFSPKLHWIICDGNITPGNWSNLPDGEVFASPIFVNGKIVIDGCLGDYFDKRYGALENPPLTVEIENNRAIKESIHCNNKILEKDFTEYLFSIDKDSDRVGEFGIGTNIGLTELLGNLLQDEKFPGVHIAFGSPYPEETGADWDSEGHIDGVILNPTIYVDDEVIMKKGKFLF
ncbi:MAG: aminopeptidase [Patescibacteria group bacterium]